MNKHKYNKPRTHVIPIPMDTPVLAGSDPHLSGTADQSGNPHDARSKENDLRYEDEEMKDSFPSWL